jgi:hypothetical protein
VENGARLWKASGEEWKEGEANACRGRGSRQWGQGSRKRREKGGSVENFHDFGDGMEFFGDMFRIGLAPEVG